MQLRTVPPRLAAVCGIAALVGVITLGIASAVGLAEEVTEITSPDRWEDLGVPVRQSRIYSQTVGKDTTGREVYYLGFVDPKQTFVLALDPLTGKGKQLDLTDTAGQVWMVCAHSNGKAYATTGTGAIFELDAAEGTTRLIGRAPEGERGVWELYEASDGNLYGGTYPNCKLARVNLATDEVQDLGRMDPEQMYVRTIATEGDFIYCGCGVTRPAVWAYNLKTGEKIQLLPNAGREGAGWGRATTRIDGRIYVYGNGKLYWRVDGLELEQVKKLPGRPRCQLDDGTRLLTSEDSGRERVYWAATPDGKRREVRFSYQCSGTRLWDVFDGPDGRIYGNTHTPITLFAFDPATGEIAVLGDPVGHAGQVYCSLWHEGKLHMAAYSDCTYTVWDPQQPWSFGTEPESNPRRIGNTSRHVQRAGCMLSLPDGEHILVGGLPGYGRLGGGLAMVQLETGEIEVIEKPVGNQSPWSLATTPDPNVIAIGTSLHGGSGTKPVDHVAKLVFWNWRQREEVSRLAPWKDETVIGSLVRLGDKLLICGAPHGKLAVYDFVQRKVIRNADFGYGAGRLRLREADDKVYTAMGGRVVRIDPATLEHDVLGAYPGLHGAVAFSGQHVYGICDRRLVRLRVD